MERRLTLKKFILKSNLNYERRCGVMTVSQVDIYNEILKLFEYCGKIGVDAEITRLQGGYLIRFRNGGDVIQHDYSYGSDKGYVEFCIGSRVDFKAVPLKRAKLIVRKNKEKLNNVRKVSK